MALIYCIVPLVLGISSFVTLLVEAYMSFYLLNYIAHVWQAIWVFIKWFKFSLLGFGS